MSPPELKLPIIDFTPYLNPTCQEDKDRVVAEVAQACADFGFFQVRGHGISLDLQKKFLGAIGTFFHQPMEKKLELSFLKNPCRRGYEGSGMSMRAGDALPDSKEAFFINREDPVFEPPGFHGPNAWPDLPEDQFKEPVWEYYQETNRLGRTIWEMFLLGLGESVDLMDKFSKRPLVPMKMIRYPPSSKTLEGQYGVGAHTDFGGITVLLQQPGEEGLEVWVDQVQQWLPVPSIEDVYIINAGNMVQRWSGDRYKSALHRVVIKNDRERLSCATFYHGDWQATNPFDETDKVSVGELLFGRFKKQFSFPEEAEQQTIDMAAAAVQKDVSVEA